MLDIKLIRKDPETIEKKIKTKEPSLSVSLVLSLDEKIREKKTEVDNLKSERNKLSTKIADLKKQRQTADKEMAQAAEWAEKIHGLDHELQGLEAEFKEQMALLPNIPMEDVKISPNAADNVIVKEFRKKTNFPFPFKNHVELNEKLNLFDFKRGAKISGTGWPVYRGMGARLEWALLQYMVSIHIKNGFEQWILPSLVRPEVMYQSGQLPKFEKQLFKIKDDDYHLYLVPTSEVPLNGLYGDEILDEEDLPLKYICYSPCFRREAGAAGSQERGLIRVHQFNKVEMFSFCKPEESEAMFDLMVKSAGEVLEGLNLHYRNCLLVTGDMSFGSAKTIDVEVWLPGQNRYYEVSSVSNCTDYQARRGSIRFRRKEGKPELVHTLNGSGVATSRLMVAILENNQQADGSVIIPEVLRPYLGGIAKIEPVA